MITDQECGISFFSKCLLLGLKLIWRQPVNLGFNSQNALVFWALSTQNAWWWKGKIFQLDGGLGYTGTRFKFSNSSQTFGMLTTRVLRNQSMNERIVNEALVCQFKSHLLTQSQPQVGNFTHGYMKKLSVRNGTQFKFHFPGVFAWLFVPWLEHLVIQITSTIKNSLRIQQEQQIE